MQAWTDYPITELGDVSGQEAPVREVEIVSYDGNKYCKVRITGVPHLVEIKGGYLYQSAGRLGTVKSVTRAVLNTLPETVYED